MQAVVLAGGLGTRLRPFTVTIPKPLLPLGDRPIIDILLSQLRASGCTRVSISLGYMAPLFQALLGEGAKWGLNIDYVVENEPLGTAGALRLLKELDEDFLVINGDTLTDLDFRLIFEAHHKARASGTIFCAEVKDYVDYGVVEFDKVNSQLVRYIEKPTRTFHVSTGLYVLNRRILRFDPGSGKLDMPDLLRAASTHGDPIQCYRSAEAYWRDIGRFDHYEAATKDFLENPARFLKEHECRKET